ncbi:MAG: hypothetical protein M1114_02335 [Candidatus Dependentiae bacterium]|nr:hypothetical protein [Candidatus Dependentiae bacterium]
MKNAKTALLALLIVTSPFIRADQPKEAVEAVSNAAKSTGAIELIKAHSAKIAGGLVSVVAVAAVAYFGVKTYNDKQAAKNN